MQYVCIIASRYSDENKKLVPINAQIKQNCNSARIHALSKTNISARIQR